MVAIGGIADIVHHWHEMARSRMTKGEVARLTPKLSLAKQPALTEAYRGLGDSTYVVALT